MAGKKLDQIYFSCQRCGKMLKIDPGFSMLDEHSVAELSLPIINSAKVELSSSQIETFSQFVQANKLYESGNNVNGFMLVGDTGEGVTFSHHLRSTISLFDLLSSTSDIDHPLCQDCADTLLDNLDEQLKNADNDFDNLSALLKDYESESQCHDIETLKNELKELKLEENALKDQLQNVEKEAQIVSGKYKEQLAIKESLDKEEDQILKKYNKFKREKIKLEDEYRSLDCQLKNAQSHLDHLSKTNVLNAAFHIWHSGHFGTINNFRLGKLPSVPVEWSEINAAWGQTALLLECLANRMNLTFERYRIVPFGNHSYIESLSEKKTLPLYSSGGRKFFMNNDYDSAMVAFLDCLQQLKEKVDEEDSKFHLPYKIDKDKIEGGQGKYYSIKIQFNTEEQWTKALKFMLTNLKWVLTWVTAKFSKDEL